VNALKRLFYKEPKRYLAVYGEDPARRAKFWTTLKGARATVDLFYGQVYDEHGFVKHTNPEKNGCWECLGKGCDFCLGMPGDFDHEKKAPVDWKLKRGKPSWKDIPGGAMWLAQDECGAWWCYGGMPTTGTNTWLDVRPSGFAVQELSDDWPNPKGWKTTLEKRPEKGDSQRLCFVDDGRTDTFLFLQRLLNASGLRYEIQMIDNRINIEIWPPQEQHP
jgi:hypothetical protein